MVALHYNQVSINCSPRTWPLLVLPVQPIMFGLVQTITLARILHLLFLVLAAILLVKVNVVPLPCTHNNSRVCLNSKHCRSPQSLVLVLNHDTVRKHDACSPLPL